ncbi:MAG: ThuA domain-containing protein [Rikenellaceae bacterium]
MKKIIFSLAFLCISFSLMAKDINVMLLTGHTDKFHDWKIMSARVKEILDEGKIFKTTVVTDYQNPDFTGYDVVVMNLNQVTWSDDTKKRFEDFVSSGGGFVSLHETDNAFPEWEEFNKMIGLGGWGGRTHEHGDNHYFKDGKFVTVNTPGKAGKHGRRGNFEIIVHEPNHPIMKGLPKKWIHKNDELYGNLVGRNFENLTVLASGYSDLATRGTGKQEPLLMVINYGKGRVFHTTLGHTGKGFSEAVSANEDFKVTLLRGAEWVATGKVKQKITFK